eukprot:15249461-Alexandrium_andersonii.AAC.1
MPSWEQMCPPLPALSKHGRPRRCAAATARSHRWSAQIPAEDERNCQSCLRAERGMGWAAAHEGHATDTQHVTRNMRCGGDVAAGVAN